MGKKIRLLTFLLRSGRFRDSNEALKALSEERVSVGGKVVASPKFEFRPSTKGVTIDGNVVKQRKEHIYLKINKPIGIICQKNDAKKRMNIFQFLIEKNAVDEREANSLVTVGRLDIDTEGLILMTTDGELANEILQPKRKIGKAYYAVVEGLISDEGIRQLNKGLKLELKTDEGRTNFMTLPAEVDVISRGKYESRIQITVYEGKRRQVKNMLRQVGNPVTFLRRIRIGRMGLGDMKLGEIKRITKGDIEKEILAD